ncbi:TPA: hypothetical protein ACGOTC_001993 [Streptococcus suis]
MKIKTVNEQTLSIWASFAGQVSIFVLFCNFVRKDECCVLEPELKARKIDRDPCVQVTQRRSPFILLS